MLKPLIPAPLYSSQAFDAFIDPNRENLIVYRPRPGVAPLNGKHGA